MRHLAPATAFVFFTAACALIVLDAWLTNAHRYAIACLALSQAAILYGYYGLPAQPRPNPPAPRLQHGRRAR